MRAGLDTGLGKRVNPAGHTRKGSGRRYMPNLRPVTARPSGLPHELVAGAGFEPAALAEPKSLGWSPLIRLVD